MGKEVFYITTPLYYVNDAPHVGTAYSTIGADVMARYVRACGREVFFLTGTDEHGLKVEKAAKEKGFDSPKALADAMAERFKDAWKVLDISYDRFIRTTDADHARAVEKFWKAVDAAGLLEKRSYEGWYCVHEETFWPETQLVQPGNLCPDCQRETSKASEENWFFKQTTFVSQLKAHLEAHPDFVQPEIRRNEILGSYLNSADGVLDQSISRSNFKWGLPVPGDAKQVIYVWFDALINYITAAGYESDAARFEKVWPADVHVIGKDILRFHAVLWPSMLMAVGLKPPKKVFGTGFILNEGKKMSKSLGNTIDPVDWARRFGVDVFRYYLLREVPFGSDGSVSEAGIQGRYNNELADVLGNLLSRSLAMYGKTPLAALTNHQDPLMLTGQQLWRDYSKAMDQLDFHGALEQIFQLARTANEYIQKAEPWKLAKSEKPEDRRLLAHELYCLLESLRLIGHGLRPFMPETAEKLLFQLGQDKGLWQSLNLEKLMCFQEGTDFSRALKGDSLFPKPELAKA
jgi:methionyl-tRNA synthetase